MMSGRGKSGNRALMPPLPFSDLGAGLHDVAIRKKEARLRRCSCVAL